MILSGKELFMYRLNKAKELLAMVGAAAAGAIAFVAMFALS